MQTFFIFLNKSRALQSAVNFADLNGNFIDSLESASKKFSDNKLLTNRQFINNCRK